MNRYELFEAGIDVSDGIRRFSGDKEGYRRFLFRFEDDEYYSRICENIQNRDLEKAFYLAHALKGIAGNLSFHELHSALIPLTEELRKGDYENIDALLSPVTQAYSSIKEILREGKDRF